MSGSLEKRIADLERRAKNRNSGVGIILPSADGAELYFDGKKRTFPTEGEAKAAFYRMAGPDAVLILW